MLDKVLEPTTDYKYPLPEHVEKNADESWALELLKEEQRAAEQDDAIVVEEPILTAESRLSAIEKQKMAWALRQNQCEEQVDDSLSTSNNQTPMPLWKQYLSRIVKV